MGRDIKNGGPVTDYDGEYSTTVDEIVVSGVRIQRVTTTSNSPSPTIGDGGIVYKFFNGSGFQDFNPVSTAAFDALIVVHGDEALAVTDPHIRINIDPSNTDRYARALSLAAILEARVPSISSLIQAHSATDSITFYHNNSETWGDLNARYSHFSIVLTDAVAYGDGAGGAITREPDGTYVSSVNIETIFGYIASEMTQNGFSLPNAQIAAVDYFVFHELEHYSTFSVAIRQQAFDEYVASHNGVDDGNFNASDQASNVETLINDFAHNIADVLGISIVGAPPHGYSSDFPG